MNGMRLYKLILYSRNTAKTLMLQRSYGICCAIYKYFFLIITYAYAFAFQQKQLIFQLSFSFVPTPPPAIFEIHLQRNSIATASRGWPLIKCIKAQYTVYSLWTIYVRI